MVDDKSLRSAVSRAAREGLTIYANGEDVFLIGGEWMVKTCVHNLKTTLRETLGEIVSMIGWIPEDESVVIRKTKDGFIAQDEMSEVVGAAIDGFAGEEKEEVFRTPLSYGWAGRLWQTEALALYGQAASCPAGIMPWCFLTDKMTVCAADEPNEEAIYVRVSRPDETSDKVLRERWAVLESVRWHE